MLEIKGLNIESLPFEGLKVQDELLDFDGVPMLLHYQYTRRIKKGNEVFDLLSFLVDFDNNCQRYLFWKITKRDLYLYLNKNISLRRLLEETESEFIYLVDENTETGEKVVKCFNSYELPEKYLPSHESFYIYGLSEYYLEYLDFFSYEDKLLKKSYTVTLEANKKNKKHENTISAKDAGAAMTNYHQSIYGFAYIKAYKEYSHLQGNDKINKQKANKFAEAISPRLTNATLCCFEFSIAMDTTPFHEPKSVEGKLSKTLIEEYKKDVLDVNYSDEEDAKIIAQNYTAAERKKIFEPIFKVLENEDIEVTVTDYKKSFSKNSKSNQLNKKFKDIVIPPKSLEELEEEQQKKNKIYTIVFTLREGTDLGKIRIKQLMDGLLFTEEGAETSFPIPSPISVDNSPLIELNNPIRCRLYIDPDGNMNLSNSTLMLNAEGRLFTDVADNIKRQFVALIGDYLRMPEANDTRFQELKSILKYPENPFGRDFN